MDNKYSYTDDKQDKALEVAKQKTREYGSHLWNIIKRHTNIEKLSNPAAVSETTSPQKHPDDSTLLKFLAIVPYILVGIFTLSFFWDFNKISAEVLGYSLYFEGILRIISISGLIGFLTNWLAITMLFKPAHKRPILGHGLIPAQKDRIANRLARAVSDDLINPEIIKKKIKESDVISRYRKQSTHYIKNIIDAPLFRKELKQWVIDYIDEMIADPEIRNALASRILAQIEESVREKAFEKIALKAYSFIKGEQMQRIIEESLIKIPASIENGLDKMDNLLDELPQKIDDRSEDIENIVTTLLYKLVNQLDVQYLVEENLRSYDEQQLSNIIQSTTNEQLQYIQYLGAVLGLIGGLVIWEPIISLVLLSTLTILILSLDSLILSAQNK